METTTIHPDMDSVEKEIVLTILDDALKCGYTLSVYDGEETVVRKSSDKNAIFSAMYSTGNDILVIYQDNKRIGWIFLVYGNREYVISDYSDYPVIEDLLKNADALTEKYS